MKAVLLAAGEGTRLKPLTEVLPKCLMPILGVPLLELWLDAVGAMGIDAVLVNTSYKSAMVREFLNGLKRTSPTQVAHEKTLLGTAGTLFANLDFIGDDDILVVHADNLSFFNPAEFLAAFQNRLPPIVATMMTFTTDAPKTCGIVEVAPDGTLTRLHEKVDHPPGNHANAAVYIFSRQFMRELKAGAPCSDISLQVLPRLLGRMNTYHNATYHRDIGNVASYLQSARDVWALTPVRSSPAWNAIADAALWLSWTKAWAQAQPQASVAQSLDQVTLSAADFVILENLKRSQRTQALGMVNQGARLLPWKVLDA